MAIRKFSQGIQSMTRNKKKFPVKNTQKQPRQTSTGPMQGPEGPVQGPRQATGPKDFIDGPTNAAIDRGALSGLSGKAKMGAAAEWGAGNFKASLRPGQSVMGGIAGDMGRGAIGGGAIGGTMEASQGGSFWDGAISGATTGAVGWGAYRSGMRATGATSRNPFSKEGIYHSGKRMSNTMAKTPEMSRQASALLRQSQTAGLSNAVTSRNL